jgi:outer membrane receptor protein involved in Fe transport
MRTLVLIHLFFLVLPVKGQRQSARFACGKVLGVDGKPVAGAWVLNQHTREGVLTDSAGNFSLPATGQTIRILISCSGYFPEEVTVNPSRQTQVTLRASVHWLEELVVLASRTEETRLAAPFTVEKLNPSQLRAHPGLDPFDQVSYLKGVSLLTSGINSKSVNSRGFDSGNNPRFLQLVDGVDNQPPGLNFAVGNLFGPPELDLKSIEVLPGASSALYGPAAFNGVMLLSTKSPFESPGLSIQVKTGVNHLNQTATKPKGLIELSVRYAKVLSEKWAYKITLSHFSATDWHARNFTDIDNQTPPQQRGELNPSRNALNIYGDEVSRSVDGVGRVSRTGYKEDELLDDRARNIKAAGSVYYRLPHSQLSYHYDIGRVTGAQTGTNRISINNYILQHHRLQWESTRFFGRVYLASEDAGDTYNTFKLASSINQTWVSSLDGKPVIAEQANTIWFERYQQAFLGKIGSVPAANHAAARTFADQGRYLPGSPEFEAEKKKVAATTGGQGAGIFSKSRFYHSDGQYDLTTDQHRVHVQLGASVRVYRFATNGTLFDDAWRKLHLWESGLYVQARTALAGNRIRITGSVRADKNQNFSARVTPRVAANYQVFGSNYLRASFQTGYRNPAPAEQYIKNANGPVTILGGVKRNSQQTGVYENSFSAASVDLFLARVNELIRNGTAASQAAMQALSALSKSDVPYLKPERVSIFEIGYRGMPAKNISIDFNYFLSRYSDFILNTRVVKTPADVLNPDRGINPSAAQDLVNGSGRTYVLFTNSTGVVWSQGAGLGLRYAASSGFQAEANATWTALNLRDAAPSAFPAFNTPKWRTSADLTAPFFHQLISVRAGWKWQSTFDWVGSLASNLPGRIRAMSLVDFQLSCKLKKYQSTVRLGAENVFNNQVYQIYGGPMIGAVWFAAVRYDLAEIKL